nr:ricin B lectin-like protein [Nosema bombycis]
MRSCDYGSNQLYTIMYNETEANELTETKSMIGSLGSPVDQNVVEKLQKMIDDNKEIARHISYTHDRHLHEHGHGHGHGRHGHRGRHMSYPDDIHHTHEELHTHSRKKEDGPFLLNFMNQ